MRHRPYIVVITVIVVLSGLLASCESLLSALELLELEDSPSTQRDDYNCADFETQADAQAIFDARAAEGDPYGLDRNGNGIACESLPLGETGIKVANLGRGNGSQLKFGNPSRADRSDLNNYLLDKPQYALSYNCSAGIPNWVAWELTPAWLGEVDRSNDFRPDPDLPPGCPVVTPTDYRRSGYDRGHMAPSADRTKSPADNSATFLMTNMIPQHPANNREVWRELEEHARDLVDQGKKLYIIAGVAGSQGTLNRKVRVPQYTWKAILVLDSPTITEQTETVAVLIPNTEAVSETNWQDYTVSIDRIENQTGLDLFSDLPTPLQKVLESRK